MQRLITRVRAALYKSVVVQSGHQGRYGELCNLLDQSEVGDTLRPAVGKRAGGFGPAKSLSQPEQGGDEGEPEAVRWPSQSVPAMARGVEYRRW